MITEILFNTQTTLIFLGTGTIIWVIRQYLPKKIENNRIWKASLRLLSIVIGSLFAIVPPLMPAGDIVQSAVVGGVVGSLTSTFYGFARRAFGNRVGLFLGSKFSKKGNE